MFKKFIFAAAMIFASASSFATQYIVNGTFNDNTPYTQTGWTTTSQGYLFANHQYFEGAIFVPGTLTQNIFGANGLLALSFDLTIGNGDANTFESVIFNGVILATYTANSIQSLSFNVMGTGSDVLSFRGWNPPSINSISNVSLVEATSAVPEPSSYLLMALGLGLVGFMARRKNG